MNKQKYSDLYLTDKYVAKNPDLHQNDSPWKVSKLLPFIDTFIKHNTNGEISILDVGGGAGLILKALTEYIEQKTCVKVKMYSADLSGYMLKIQRQQNVSICGLLKSDVQSMPFLDKQFDLVLMVDVIEHIPKPEFALKELKRISRYVLFNVPLENNFILNISNLARNGAVRLERIASIGHINVYCYRKFRLESDKYLGDMVQYSLVDLYDLYHHTHTGLNSAKSKVIFGVSNVVFKFSKLTCVSFFGGSMVALVKSRQMSGSAI
jgi:SAM-dependent methyltransferase